MKGVSRDQESRSACQPRRHHYIRSGRVQFCSSTFLAIKQASRCCGYNFATPGVAASSRKRSIEPAQRSRCPVSIGASLIARSC